MTRSTPTHRASPGLMSDFVETEIGLLPKTWPLHHLGDVFETQLGKMLSQKAHGGDAPKPYLRNKNVQWGSIDTSDILEMDFSEREKAKFQLRPGDLLVCEGGVPGRAAIWNGAIEECYYQKALHRLRPRNGSMISEFMLYWLRFAFDLQNLYGVSGASSTIAHLPEAQLKALSIPVPPLTEQRRIAELLGMAQRAIEQQDRLIALTTELKRALLHQLFTQGLRRESQKQTELGPMPHSWEPTTLGTCCDIVSGSISYTDFLKMASEDDGDTIECMAVKVSDMNLPGNQQKFVSANAVRRISAETGHNKLVPPNTIIFPKRGAAIATNKKRLTTTWTVLDPNLIGLRPKDSLDANFLFHWVQTFDLRRITDPGPTPQLNKKDLIPVLIPLPKDIYEQRDIASVISTIDRKLILNQGKHDALTALFRTLLHQLMTGQLRVGDLDLSSFALA